jgi:hypothetical protein
MDAVSIVERHDVWLMTHAPCRERRVTPRCTNAPKAGDTPTAKCECGDIWALHGPNGCGVCGPQSISLLTAPNLYADIVEGKRGPWRTTINRDGTDETETNA